MKKYEVFSSETWAYLGAVIAPDQQKATGTASDIYHYPVEDLDVYLQGTTPREVWNAQRDYEQRGYDGA